MTKEDFHKSWQYRLLQVLFWSSLAFFSIALILLGIFESDVEIAGFVWAAVLTFTYWLMKRIAYYVMFGDTIVPIVKAKK